MLQPLEQKIHVKKLEAKPRKKLINAQDPNLSKYSSEVKGNRACDVCRKQHAKCKHIRS